VHIGERLLGINEPGQHSGKIERHTTQEGLTMIMADTLAIFFTVLGLMLATPALWLLCRGLWPDLVLHSAVHCRHSLVKPFFIGLPIAVFGIIGVAVLSKFPQPLAAITIIGFICLILIYAHVGVTAIASVLGERLPSPADIDRPWNATVRGGIVLELSYLLPVIGWFIILPVSLIVGAGLTTRSLFSSRKKKTSQSPGQLLSAEPALNLQTDGSLGAHS
jgi:hypothetical protein